MVAVRPSFSSSDSTLNIGPSADVRELEPASSRHRLLTFHGHQGKPIRRFKPPAPPAEMCWNARYLIQEELGQGSQGVVYRARRDGVDGYYTDVALKVFYPNPSFEKEEYLEEMRRVAIQARRVSGVQHDNLISIRDFVALGETRIMVLEYVDGLDLDHLLDLRRFRKLEKALPEPDWKRLNQVIVTEGEDHCQLKPGIAVDIISGCLAGLSALHHRGIVHCDLKPSNIMVKRTGTEKIVDIDSSCALRDGAPHFRGTPYYMAPEQLARGGLQVHSDIASLGYILIELLTGRLLFRDCDTEQDLLEAKRDLPKRLDDILPSHVKASATLVQLVRKMIAVEPKDRFPDADAAELDRRAGTASFQRQLVKMDLATEYDRELAWWLESMGRIPPEPAAGALI